MYAVNTIGEEEARAHYSIAVLINLITKVFERHTGIHNSVISFYLRLLERAHTNINISQGSRCGGVVSTSTDDKTNNNKTKTYVPNRTKAKVVLSAEQKQNCFSCRISNYEVHKPLLVIFRFQSLIFHLLFINIKIKSSKERNCIITRLHTAEREKCEKK